MRGQTHSCLIPLTFVTRLEKKANMWNLCFASFLLIITFPQYTNSHPVIAKSRNHSSSYSFYNGQRTINTLNSVEYQLLNKWTSTALKFFDFHRCVASNIASSEDECFQLNQILRSKVAVYFAGINAGSINSVVNNNHDNSHRKEHKVIAVFPDSPTPKSGGSHDAVLALDPYPDANFGHLVAVFYIDLGVDSRKCKEEYQIFTTDDTCITVAKKPRCPNRLERYTGGGLQPRRCHIDFLPTVYHSERFTTPTVPSGSSPDVIGLHLNHDLLNCVNLSGFAHCPILRPLEDTRRVLCDGAAVNSKRCDTSHAGVGTRCKLFQTCDRAVLVGGGWNRLHSDMKSFQNIIKMQESLSSMGFLPENIKTFYANGKSRSLATGRNGRSMYDDSSYFSSAMKTGLRGHLRTICETTHCADSLYIYLNNPTNFEGDMLLWDMDYNGMIDELEIYTVKEFLSDILGCEARRVIIIVDQSNPDILLNSLKESSEHKNVMLFTAGLSNKAVTNGEFTNLWANHSESFSCIKHIQQNIDSEMQDSNPIHYDATSGILSKVSLVGAPCDLNPPVNSRELKTLYEGCQNVPTSVWFSATFEDVGNTDDDSQGGIDESEENSPSGRRT